VFSELDYFNQSKMNKYWWTNFMFIDNIHPVTGDQAMIWGSFFSLEIQLFIVLFPMIVVIIYNEVVGYLTLSAVCLGSLITAFFYSKSKDLHLSSFVNSYEVGRYIEKPWNKVFPYAFGILIGIVIWRYNNSNIRGTYIGKLSRVIQQSTFVSWAMHILANVIIITLVLTIHAIDHNRDGNTKFSSSVWLILSQIFIPLALSMHLLPL
jgi:hypothetical protein